MGKFLGDHEYEELDRPDLNKCPDCRCFFAGDSCPLCGKECPEEMRAGNRAKVKPPKASKNRDSGRVTFIAWYHSWLCIILMLFVMPVIGIILLCTSPHRTRTKIIVIACIVGGAILLTFVLPVLLHFSLLGLIGQTNAPLVDDSISMEEYTLKCRLMEAEDFYRNADGYSGNYLHMELVVVSRITDTSAILDEYSTYYICQSPDNESVRILIRDCVLEGSHNFISGDRVVFYGEGAGNRSVTESDMTVTDLPCLNAAYASLIRDN